MRQSEPNVLCVIAAWAALITVACLSLMPLGVQAQQPTPAQIRAMEALGPEAARALIDEHFGTSDVSQTSKEAPLAKPEIDIQSLRALSEEESDKELRVTPTGSIVVVFEVDDEKIESRGLEPETIRSEIELDPILSELVGGHDYVIDPQGRLSIRGLEPMYLSGLTTEEAAIRIAANSRLKYFSVSVTILPLDKEGQASLSPFGYEMFEKSQLLSSRPNEGPVPANYIIGAGDTVLVNLFGNVSADYELLVTRDGILNFPELGPISVTGMQFSGLVDEIKQQVAEKLIGTRVSVTMGPLRAIQVYVLGDVPYPGSYTISGLSTVTGALFSAGGVSEIGSLRRIQHRRNSQLLETLDLYDLLLRGDTSDDGRIQSGDVVFVPPVGKQVSVAGAVLRPAVYELAGDTTVDQIINIAGGLLPEADPASARVFRIDSEYQRVVLNLNLRTSGDRQTRLDTGDFVDVPKILAESHETVMLTGHVARGGEQQWFDGLRVSHLFPSTDVLLPQADLNYVLIRRQPSSDAPVTVLSVDLEQALRNRGTADDAMLMARDTIIVFDRETGRDRQIDRILEELRLQATRSQPAKEVRVEGLVKVPGRYPLELGMRITDLIRAGGGLSESAYEISAELARYSIEDNSIRITELISINLSDALLGNESSNLELSSYDYLTIKKVTDWGDQEQVTLEGEFVFPGTYQIRKGETLGSVIERAGGFSSFAFPEGAVFVRDSLKEREQQQLDLLARRLKLELTAATMIRIQDTPGAAQAVALGESLVEQLDSAEAVGRLVINLSGIAGGTSVDLELQDGDLLTVPLRSQEVTIIGEVQFPTSHIFSAGLSKDDYIDKSGGLTANADKKRIYVVKANGAVISTPGSKWFGSSEQTRIQAGDTIVVPLDADRVSKLRLVTSVSQIIFQLGVLAAAATR